MATRNKKLELTINHATNQTVAQVHREFSEDSVTWWPLDPIPLATNSQGFAAFATTFNAIVLESLSAVTAERDTLASQYQAILTEYTQAQQDLTDLNEMVQTLTSQVADQPTIESLQSQLSAAHATIESLTAQLAQPIAETRPSSAHLYPYEFRERFTPEERSALRAAARTVDQLADYLETVYAVRWVIVTDALTITGVQALVSLGIIAPNRVAEILSPITT